MRDRNDEMGLERAVAARCGDTVTYHQRDFSGADKFAIRGVLDARMALFMKPDASLNPLRVRL